VAVEHDRESPHHHIAGLVSLEGLDDRLEDELGHPVRLRSRL
jgi:hypothetical protein